MDWPLTAAVVHDNPHQIRELSEANRDPSCGTAIE
jgi:hypothetical protein